jgi:thiosulfate/3-mercaptopyruvate sulfurtransferase
VRATYCQGGVRAALVWFVLHELAGFEDVRSYAGSWEEWGNRTDSPIDMP